MNDTIKFECVVERSIFQGDNDYKVYRVKVNKKKYPNIKPNNNDAYVICGNVHNLVPNIKYTVEGKEAKNKYGYQYKISNIYRDRPTTTESSRKFLMEVITDKQADTLLSVYPNIIDKIINNDLDDIDLNLTKGIKDKTFAKIKNSIINNFCLIDLVDKFDGNLSFSIVKKLYDKYTSTSITLQKMKQNPYGCLCSLARVSFKTADQTLLSMQEQTKIKKQKGETVKFDFNYELKYSKQRMQSCIEYILQQNELNGNTNIDIREVRQECNKLTPECINHFVNVIKESNSIHIDKKTKTLALALAYNAEKYIANTLVQMLKSNDKMRWSINTEFYREDHGLKLTDEQIGALDYLCQYNVSLLTAPAGCVDKDTEFFNGILWKKISEYNEGDLVLQYNENCNAELVKPIRYIKQPCEYMTLLSNKTNSVNQVLSDEHNVVYLSDKNNIQKKPLYEIKKMHQRCKNGFSGRFITTFNYNGQGIQLTDDEIRLMMAVICDGHFRDNTNRCRVNLKKERKKERLEEILHRTKIPFEKKESSTKGYHVYHFIAPRHDKIFTSYWYNCSQHQLHIIKDEILYWDGHFGQSYRRSFSTTHKMTADFVQFVFSACGERATIHTLNRKGENYITNNKIYKRKSIEYEVIISHRGKTVSIEGRYYKNKLKKYKTLDGFKYCFTVPSGMLILRRKDRIFITGNCGKSQSVKMMVNMLEDNHKSYLLMTPTGKAGDVLSEYTDRDAGTIHRQLKYNPQGENPWFYNEQNKLDVDVVFIDEFGMVDIYLMKHLLEAIDVTKTKLVLVFDSYQLSSVGCGNIAHDLLMSKIIPTTILTKIFRYNEGGLMQIATKIRNSEKFLPSTFNSVKIFGTKKDYIYIEKPQNNMVNEILKIYKKLLKDGCEFKDIMVLTAYNKGGYGTKVVNQHIQKMIQSDMRKKYVQRGDTKFYVGDKVIQITNNYKAMTLQGEETEIYNGNTGVVTEISFNEMVVEFKHNSIIYTKDDLDQLELGYCITTHKSQGDNAENIILITPKAHTYMLNSNLMYVGVTRAKKRVYHIGNIRTINLCIKKKENWERNTYLKDLLIQEYNNLINTN